MGIISFCIKNMILILNYFTATKNFVFQYGNESHPTKKDLKFKSIFWKLNVDIIQ